MIKHIAGSLVKNIDSHWNDEIKIISKLVISKLIKYDDNFLRKIEPVDRKFIASLDLSEYSEEMWGVHFDLKGE